VAADFMLIAGDGKVLNREQDLEPVKSGEVKFDSMMTDEVKVFVYGDTAIITGIGTYQINYKGQSSTISERFYDIYQKRKGEWLVIASRPSSVPKKKSED
jgi:ketosteroid isomerase-like protein